MTRHVAVVGAGVVGLFCALYARQAGFEVTVIDRCGPQRATASYGNAGLVVPSHVVPLAAPGALRQGLRWLADPESPFSLRPELDPELLAWGWRFWRASTDERARRAGPLLRDLHLEGKRTYDALSERLGDPFGWRASGLIMASVSQHGLEEEGLLAARAVGLGLPARLLSAADVAALQPDLQLDVAGGVYYPEDGMLDPGRLMVALQAHLQELGVVFRWDTRVEGLVIAGGRVERLRLADAAVGGAAVSDTLPLDTLPLDALVLAAGVGSAGLARSLGLRLPMRAGKGYSMTLPDAPERPSLPMLLTEGRVAITPLPGGVRFGGTMEITGARGTGANGSTGGSAHGVRARRVRGLVRSVVRALPGYRLEDFASAPVWHGLRPLSPDGLPYLGRSGCASNLIVATGHAMMGVSLAPVTGLLVQDLLEGRDPRLPLAALSPDRYA